MNDSLSLIPALSVRDLSVTYANGHQAVTGVSFVVPSGGTLSLVGTSGSGKTTILRAVLGLLPADAVVSGSIEVDGRDLLGLSARELRAMRGRTIGYVSQDPFAACDPLRQVRHHVAEAWVAHGESVPATAIASGLSSMEIPDAERRMKQRPHQWSGGMLQRATTLAATAHDPVLTLADEPTSALDAELADGALELLRSTSTALLVVTHDLALAARHTARVIVLSAGRIIEEGESQQVLAAPRHDLTRSLVEAASPRRRVLGASTEGDVADVVIEATDISKSYAVRGSTVTAVQPTSLHLRAAEVVGLVGPSGSGKSSLLRLLAAMERPDTGVLRAGGDVVWGRSRSPELPRKGFVMPVFQDPVGSVDPRWPLWRTITEPLVLTGVRMGKDERRERAAKELAAVEMGEIDVDRLPGSLSVGQCQRVAFVRALVAHPAVIAADEPTASLDVEMAAVVAEMIRESADRGAAVVVVSHDEVRLRSVADRLFRVRDGVVTADA